MLGVVKHGTCSTYDRYKCRCDLCKAAMAAYTAKRRERLRGTEPPVHGYRGYTVFKCRCDVCSAAYSDYSKKRRELLYGTEPPSHGHSAYINFNCRCDVCKAGMSAYTRSRRAERRVYEQAYRARKKAARDLDPGRSNSSLR